MRMAKLKQLYLAFLIKINQFYFIQFNSSVLYIIIINDDSEHLK